MRFVRIWLAGAVCAMAMDYGTFEKRVVEKAPAVQALQMDLKVAKIRGEIATRYDNPQLQLEASRFEREDAGSDGGWRTAVEQPLRVIGLTGELKGYADALTEQAAADVTDRLIRFKMVLRSRYLAWVRVRKEVTLARQSVVLAKRVETIAAERFKGGAGTRAKAMQAQLVRLKAETNVMAAEREARKLLGALLAYAGLGHISAPQPRFLYDLKNLPVVKERIDNSIIEKKLRSARLHEADAKRNDHLIRSWRLGAEYEKEPDQSIARVNVGFGLPFFNKNRQERQLARIRAEKTRLETRQLERSQRATLRSLLKRYGMLRLQSERLKERIEKEKRLLQLFEEGYQTSQSSLLDLIATKNALVGSKRELLDIRYLANLYRLKIDYIQGDLQ